jgi:hypothetical protein
MLRPARWFACLVVVSAALFPDAAFAGPSTPLRTWTPGSDATFKTATVCHDVTRDVYVVGAVFHRVRTTPFFLEYDQLYRLRVQGNSAATNYGQLVDTPAFVAGEARIDNVDCASDGAGKVWVTYDRYGSNAAFVALDGTSIGGPFEVPTYACGPTTHKPRIAYGGGRLMVAFEGFNYGDGGASCEACVRQFSAATGAPISGAVEAIWNDNMTHTDYDVEWNGSDRFVFALPFDIDAGSNWLSTYTYSGSTGLRIADNAIQQYVDGASPYFPQRTKIVFSKNTRNPNRMYIQTDTGSFWTDTNGARVGAPLLNAIGTGFAACEYWGADAAVASVFAPSVTWRYVGTWPTGYLAPENVTTRLHFGLASGAAYESFTLNPGFNPVACDGGDTYADPEVLLLSKPASSAPNTNVTWNVVASD